MKKIVGLTNQEVIASREKHGANSLVKEKRKGFIRRFLSNLNDPIIKILIAALVIEVVFTLGQCNLIEVFGIVVAILIATTVSTLSELGSERAFLKMQADAKESVARVLRNGYVALVPSSDLVVGDIVYCSRGEKIYADATVISGSLSVDQSALNGESKEVMKRAVEKRTEWDLLSENRVFSGTVAVNGDAVLRVERVGLDTFYGTVAKDVQAETRVSPLKLRLSRLAAQISKIGYIMAGIVAIVFLFNALVVKNEFSAPAIINSLKDFKYLFSLLIRALTLTITVIVVAVPEGLPMMITVVLSANMKKMLKDNVLVKKLVGIETAGSMNILFTDKTGTITVGEPKIYSIETVDSTYKTVSSLKRADKIYQILLNGAIYNTDATVSEGRVIGGNGTDRAITGFFINEQNKKLRVLNRDSFSSENKTSSVKLSDGNEYLKGAPEILISRSNYVIDSAGVIKHIDRSCLENKLRELSIAGNRVLAVGCRDREHEGYIFAAFIVLKDKLRSDSRRAIESIGKAGIQIVMLTGDGKQTAYAVARECGIIKNCADEVVITSDELSRMSDDEVIKIMPRLRVLARALPQDKTRLVRIAQQMNLVVGMTGDGINDAPSLKLADVGFAMGNGADIAKNAGDIVIVNNSLFAINRTVLYGRTIFKSIRKFISFQLVMNLAACGVSVLGQLLGVDTPITIIQMLWVNIIMDTLGGLAFAGEPALEYYMSEKPKKRDESLLSKEMVIRILTMGAYTLGLCLVFLKVPVFRQFFSGGNSYEKFLTAFYALFIFLGIFNCFSARSERLWIFSNISKNIPFVLIMLLISVIQLIMIFFGGEIFRSVPLNLSEIGLVIALAFSIVLFDIIRRIFRKLSKKR